MKEPKKTDSSRNERIRIIYEWNWMEKFCDYMVATFCGRFFRMLLDGKLLRPIVNGGMAEKICC